MNNTQQNFRVGLFFLLGVALAWVTFESLTGGEIFKTKGYPLYAGFSNLKGLKPGDAHALRRAHPFVFPGYHLNKKHWVTVVAPGEVTGAGSLDDADAHRSTAPDDAPEPATELDEITFERLVRELVVDSYRNVVLGLPKAKRPVDPMRFGS